MAIRTTILAENATKSVLGEKRKGERKYYTELFAEGMMSGEIRMPFFIDGKEDALREFYDDKPFDQIPEKFFDLSRLSKEDLMPGYTTAPTDSPIDATQQRLRQQMAALPEVKTQNLKKQVYSGLLSDMATAKTVTRRNELMSQVTELGFDVAQFISDLKNFVQSPVWTPSPVTLTKSSDIRDFENAYLAANDDRERDSVLMQVIKANKLDEFAAHTGMIKKSNDNVVSQICPSCGSEMDRVGGSFVCPNSGESGHSLNYGSY